jgi:excinuclease UvrABC helicase subunit UvrB
MSQTYVEKLESHFHSNFIKMQVNQDQKRWNIVSYVRMLEQMCKDRKIDVQREHFPVTNNFIYIQDQTSTEKCWTIEEETDNVYKIFHYDLVSMIAKSKVYRDIDGRLKYVDSLHVPEDVNRFSLDFYRELFIDNMKDTRMEAG